MKHWLACSAAAVALTVLGPLATAPAHAAAETYEIDPAHLSIGFLVDHVGYGKVLGMFLKGRGTYRFDEASGALSAVRVEVETDSVFSNQRQRDGHLRGDEFLNARKHPKMVFTAEGAKRTGPRTFEVAGQLELLGQAHPLTLQATWNKSAESPLPGKRYTMGVSARGTVKRSVYGMNYALSNGWVGDDIEVIIEFEAVRQ
ncbi:YceI family protein [Aquincola sp. MAHUQ-54]|uniref:YceI family protein n=1 Tax=Aquincola agrisoli TaxID=3119538 RepID=A0AAW9QBD3_9BURK